MAISVPEARDLVMEFCRSYPVASQLFYYIRDTVEELYGERAKGWNMKGAYMTGPGFHPGRCDIACSQSRNAKDFLMTLRHEVFGHFGLNTFTSDEKKALIESISAAREEPLMRMLWMLIDKSYSGKTENIKAEEVFALACENIEPDHINRENIHSRGEKSFQETCIARSRPMQYDDLENITLMVAQGLHDRTRAQKNFPQFNQQFERERGMNKKPFHEVVAEKLIEQLQAGTAPWQRPWEPGMPGAFMPINPTTGKRYKGINAIQLMSEGYADHRWMTYKQAIAMDAQVRRGEKGTPIQYWKLTEEQIKTDDAGRPVLDERGQPIKEEVKLERPKVFFATVFNAEQIDGLPPLPPLERKGQTWDTVERAEHILQTSGAVIQHGGRGAFYRPSTDSINLPNKEQFPTADNYYATALHELGHWTGHPTRLHRDLAHPFGSDEYAKEELRAEIASMILGDELGIGHDPGQHAAYVASWIRVLKNDPSEIFRAAADAEKIQSFVLAFDQQLIQDQPMQRDIQNQEEVMKQSSESIVGYDNQSWQMMKAEAERNSYSARIDIASGANGDFYEITYYGRQGDPTGIRTEMYGDGTLMTEYNGKILSQSVSNDSESQAAALRTAIELHEKAIAERQRQPVSEMTPEAADRLHNGKRLSQFISNDSEDQPKVLRTAIQQYEATKQAELIHQNKQEDRIYLAVPYSEKDDAKALGACWDRQQQSWYVQGNLDVALFEKWEIDAQGVQSSQAQEQEPIQERTYLAVPYEERAVAKAAGALWDKDKKSWYIPSDLDITPVAKWIAETHQGIQSTPPQAQEPIQERTYLAVPYGEREAAKAVGALWDKAAKSWYVGPKADMESLQRWLPDNIQNQQGPAMTPQAEFADALRSLGCEVSGEHPIMDGEKHRINLKGEKFKDGGLKSGTGFYIAYLDDHPAGYIKNNRTGVEMRWKSKGYTLTPEEKANMQAEAASKLAARAEQQRQAQERVAERVSKELIDLVPVTVKTPYLALKDIVPQAGVYTDQDGQKTYIPAIDADGKQWTMQYIQEDGTKRFAKDSRKEGCFHPIGGLDAVAAAPVLVIAEGYATAASVSQALGYATVAAFDSGNLEGVAKALHEKFSDKPVIIAGDDDRHLEMTQGTNVGKVKALAAAKAVGGQAIFPVFAAGETWPKGMKAITPQDWRAHQNATKQISAEQLGAVQLMKRHTDFNDIVTKSVLGMEGMANQVKAAVSHWIEKQQVNATDQKQTQQENQKKKRTGNTKSTSPVKVSVVHEAEKQQVSTNVQEQQQERQKRRRTAKV